MGKEGQVVPEMTDEWVHIISERYIELFEKVTGKSFRKMELNSEEIFQKINSRISELSELRR
jgi:phosphoribosylaminoimidazole-succinocarboxamide synthase